MTFADRHRLLTDYVGGGADPADPAQVLAMPVVLHIEKNDPPPRRALLEAAARAAVLLCLDERADAVAPDAADPDPATPNAAPPAPGPWHDGVATWCDARIRKISRRARGAHWVAAQEVAGLTVDTGEAQARAIVPGPVGDLDKRIARLQIGGTDVDGDLDADPTSPGELILWINPTLDMTVGKLAAQVGHASMLAAGLFDTAEALRWWRDGCPLEVAVASEAAWSDLLRRGPDSVAPVRDAGFTEVAPGSVTVIAERALTAPQDRTLGSLHE
ncbi:aminoacyl-tRNA hydrolase [Williamsia maris]|uniref:peptidyl-tRNA hydrolase n=1 Tax=Williamsia maris TaxID=72806 RepID=A0ABT1HG74_9NOCA|nr:aminoacyl-tRNA hydrolase [Williamsia maris]MCP2177252.1 Peptidyl-tRNA hydrolase [Williamsia maris]